MGGTEDDDTDLLPSSSPARVYRISGPRRTGGDGEEGCAEDGCRYETGLKFKAPDFEGRWTMVRRTVRVGGASVIIAIVPISGVLPPGRTRLRRLQPGDQAGEGRRRGGGSNQSLSRGSVEAEWKLVRSGIDIIRLLIPQARSIQVASILVTCSPLSCGLPPTLKSIRN